MRYLLLIYEDEAVWNALPPDEPIELSILAGPVRRRVDNDRGGWHVQYMLLIYGNDTEWEQRPDDEKAAIYGEYRQVSETAGIKGGAELQPATTATTVRVQDGETLTTDGPFSEAKEVLGGYFLFEAGDLDSAIEIASRIPAARHGAVEVRPVVER
jgi:hypothetical protein